ncbi:hypothetical protein AALO_G00114130 [Alosa alosa]|uniref:Uncharacterized protein n=1 Tax=Alosa alosa TaxID=278164 RepID=A0AAV6GU48_9TELE|nr:hypothetical protein AALO_G00114130 [Alosa alosa]
MYRTGGTLRNKWFGSCCHGEASVTVGATEAWIRSVCKNDFGELELTVVQAVPSQPPHLDCGRVCRRIKGLRN